MAHDYLTEAFIRIRQKLKWISGGILKDDAAAEDVLQDSFVRLWQKQYQLESEKDAEALLARTVRNTSINARRQARPEPLKKDFADDSPSAADKERAYAEMHNLIEQKLTARQRYILEEKEYAGRTLEDIARELKMEPAAVRMQLSRARQTLRNALKDE